MSNGLERVLIVDDDINLLKELKEDLCKYYDVDTAPGDEEALAQLESDGPYQESDIPLKVHIVHQSTNLLLTRDHLVTRP